MAKRKFIDWDSIEPLYRAGNLSLNEICAQYEIDHINSQVWKTSLHHSAIIKKAQDKKWTRNLADKVKKRIKEKLVTSQFTTCDTNKKLSDNEIIEQVAEVGSSIIVRHREEIKALLSLEDALLLELKNESELDVLKKSATLKNLAAVRAQRIMLERQANNLDDDETSDGFEERLKDIMK